MWVVLGLGNPGARYEGTRHNVGFLVVDALATRHDAGFERREGYWSATTAHAGVTVLLVKPSTYVNRSGGAARAILAQHGLEPSRLLVVVDDIYLPFGRLRLRPGGSAGGHNGLASIEAALQTRDYPRLRVGVGAPVGTDLVDHVLGPWSAAELDAVPETIERAALGVEAVLELGVESARPQVNAAPPPP